MKMVLFAEKGREAVVPSGVLACHWEDRPDREGEISIPGELEERLLEIRTENMRWAYEIGIKRDGTSSLAEDLECGSSPSMWWTSILYERHPRISPELYPVYKLRCLEMLMEEKNVTSLEVRGGDKTLIKTLKALCGARGISFAAQGTGRKKSDKSLTRRIYEFFPAPLRAIVRYAHWYLTVRRTLPYARLISSADTLPDKKQALIVSYFPNIDLLAAAKGRFRSRYWENLHNLLNEAAQRENPDGPHFVNWLFIRFPSPDLTLKECLGLCREFAKEGKDGASFYYLEQFLDFKGLCKSVKRWLGLCLASLRKQGYFARNCHFHNSSLNFWPYVKWQWEESTRGWRSLERCLQNTAFRHYAKNSRSKRWVLFPLENCPWERMLTEASREYDPSVPVYGVQHSIIRPTDFRYFDDPQTFSNPVCSRFQPDVCGANGLSGLRQWADNGMPPQRQRELEALRYQYFVEDGLKLKKSGSVLPPQPGEPLELPGERLLVLTSFFKDETSAHLDLLRKALESGLLDKWRVIIKPHPYLPVEAWRESLAPRLANRVEIIDTPLSLALSDGGFIWASNSTTASLEAALYGLPLMVMSSSDDFDLCPIQNVPNLARTSSLEDVKKYLLERPVPDLPANYLDLSPGLDKWRKLLDLY